MEDDRAYRSYERELKKDRLDIDRHKSNYIKQIKNGLGDKINDINTYIKEEPSRWVKFKKFINKVFKYI